MAEAGETGGGVDGASDDAGVVGGDGEEAGGALAAAGVAVAGDTAALGDAAAGAGVRTGAGASAGNCAAGVCAKPKRETIKPTENIAPTNPRILMAATLVLLGDANKTMVATGAQARRVTSTGQGQALTSAPSEERRRRQASL
jgi:hypothetical protein